MDKNNFRVAVGALTIFLGIPLATYVMTFDFISGALMYLCYVPLITHILINSVKENKHE